MKTDLLDVNETRKNLNVEIPSTVVDAEIARVAARYSRSARIPGFRPGKAPQNLLEQRYGKDVGEDVIRRLIPTYYEKAIRQAGLVPVVVEVLSPEKYAAWVDAQKKKPAAGGAAMDGKAVHDKVCAACHANGIAGAPKTGDKVAWAARIKQGQEALYANALKGIRAMPPKGGAPDLPDAQIKAAVDYLTAQAK